MRGGLASVLLFTVGIPACGGSSKKATSAPAARPAPQQAQETPAALPLPTGDGSTPQDVEPVLEAPASAPLVNAEPSPPPKPQPPKPPGLDMAPEQRAQVVNDRLSKGAQALRGRDADTAIRESRAALDADETNILAMIVLAHAYYLKEYDDKAEAILQIAKKAKEGEDSPVLWMLLGLIAERGSREGEALSAYEKATALKSDYAAAWINRGAIYLKRRRYKDAGDAFEQAVRVQSKSAVVRTNLASAYRGLSAEKLDDASGRDDLLRRSEAEYKTAMAQDPNYAKAFFNLGLLYLDADPFPGVDTLKRLSLAMQYFKEYKRLASTNLKANDPVDEYLAKAQKDYDKEVKRQEQKRKAAERKKKAAEEPPPPAEPPPAEPPPAEPPPAEAAPPPEGGTP